MAFVVVILSDFTYNNGFIVEKCAFIEVIAVKAILRYDQEETQKLRN